MYRINLFVRFLILIMLYVIIIFTCNPIINWLLFVTLVLLHLFFKKYYSLFLDLIVAIVLFLTNYYAQLLLPYKLCLIVLYTIFFITTLNLREKLSLNLIFNKKKNKILRSSFYDDNYKKVNVYNKEKVLEVYQREGIDIDEKNIRDLDRLYLQSRIRFNGFKGNNNNSYFKVNKIDIMVLLLSIIIFAILFIFR